MNWYALLVGLLSVSLLSLHGANFVAIRTEGELQARARAWARRLFGPVAGLLVVVSICSFFVRPDLGANFRTYPYLALLPLLVVACLIAIPFFQKKTDDNCAALASSALIGALMGSAGASLYPMLLPALGKHGQGLNIYNAAAPHLNLVTAAIANLIAFAGVLFYGVVIHKIFGGKMRMDEGHGY